MLEIAPSHGDVNDRLDCRLVTRRLGSSLDFIALSTLIGEGDAEVVVVNGRKTSIAGNVAQALRNLRQVFLPPVTSRSQERRKDGWVVHFFRKVGSIFPSDPNEAANNVVLVWLDLLCINPNNEHEKTKRRLAMYEVFQAAKMTVGWLGPADDLSGIAVDTMQDISKAMPTLFGDPEDRKAHPENYSPQHRWVRQIEYVWEPPVPGDYDSVYEAETPKALAGFLSRQYFQRDWILEEIAMATFPAFLIGDRIVSWRDVLRMNKVMEEMRDNDSDVFPRQLRPLVHNWPLGTIYALLKELEKNQKQEGLSSGGRSMKSAPSSLSDTDGRK